MEAFPKSYNFGILPPPSYWERFQDFFGINNNVVFPKNYNFGVLPPPSYWERFQNCIGDNKGLITYVGGAATAICFYNAYRNIRVLSNPSLSPGNDEKKHIVKTILWATGGVFSVGLSIIVNK